MPVVGREIGGEEDVAAVIANLQNVGVVGGKGSGRDCKRGSYDKESTLAGSLLLKTKYSPT